MWGCRVINLMPPKIKQDIKFARYNVTLIQYCILVLVVSAAVTSIMIFGLTLMAADERAVNDAIAERQATLASLKATDDEARQLSTNISTISALLAREVSFSEVIQKLGAVMPIGARVQDLSLTGDSSAPLGIVVIVDTQAKAAVVRQNIDDSEDFAGADIIDIVNGETNEAGNVVNYQVTMTLGFKVAEAPKPTPAQTPSAPEESNP
jgi:flavin-binding protein dodecin